MASQSSVPTQAMLTAINHDGPIRLKRLGEGNDGLVWTVQPENFETVVRMVNEYGGPACWEIEAL